VRARNGLQSRNGRGRSVATLPLLPDAVIAKGEQRSSTTAVKVVVNVPAAVARTMCTRTESPTATRTVTRSAARKWTPWTANGCRDIVRSAGAGRRYGDAAAGARSAAHARSNTSLRTPEA
jgi:hypothetical protein